jgi:hypothetical protein
MAETQTITEADILADALFPDGISAEAARLILRWEFPARAARRMRSLLNRNNKGVLTQAEEAELEKYRRVGLLLDLLRARAHIALKHSASAS